METPQFSAQGDGATCRICRCEGTDSQPLFHPCKCRGSIKYIHQECLQDWLAHSQKDTCDICHTKYTFLDVFQSSAPERPPLRLLAPQIIQKLIAFQYSIVKYCLMAVCAGFEVPAFINSVDRITDWQLGVPVPALGMVQGLIYGSYTPTNETYVNIQKVFENTIGRGYSVGIIYFIIIGSMMLIQSSIVTDDGFKKIIRRKIGMDLKPRLGDAIRRGNGLDVDLMRERAQVRADVQPRDLGFDPQIMLALENVIAQNRDNVNINEMVDMLFEENRAMRELRAEEESLDRENRQLDEEEGRILLDQEQLVREGVKYGFDENQNPIFSNTEDPEVWAEFERKHQSLLIRENETKEQRLSNEAKRRRLQRAREERQRVLIGRINEFRLNQRRQQQQQQQGQDDFIPDDIQDFWTSPKNIGFILQVTVLANLVSCAVIVTFKMIPGFIGLVSISLFDHSFILALKFLISKLSNTNAYYIVATHVSSYMINSNIWKSLMSLSESSLAIKLTKEYITKEIIKPFFHAYIATSNWKPLDTFFSKFIMVFFGYATIGITIAITMKKIESSCSESNPLTSNARRFYILLLQLTHIIKVLTLMSIEWAVFPFYSGFLIQFALVAFSSETVYTTELPHNLILRNALGILPIWFMGTFFMYFFASFVGMIRKDIFRPGVLFFIRPSDDPNVRLIHDALMRPFGLKISRIFLSAGVYTLYIFIEIISPMWLVRLLSPVDILPVHHKYWFETGLYMALFVIGQSMNEFFVKYWKFVFNIACSKMRLSSFLLNVENNNERGRIAYRNILAKLKRDEPDYDSPVQEDNIKQYFNENPTVSCAFIPDGNFVRAPDNDSVSRKFVRTLFVPVSKNDKLLAPMPDIPDDEHIFNPYDDEEPLDATTYTLVYRPPLFKTRIAGFFSILFLGSMAFTIGLYISNCSFKFILSSVFGGNGGFPNQYYQIDPYSALITIFIISHYKVISLLFKRDGGLNESLTMIKEMTNRFINNDTVKFIASKLWLCLMIPTLIGLGNQKLLVNDSPISWIDFVIAQILLIPFGYALSTRISKPQNFKFYNICTIIFIILRFITLGYFSYGFGKETGSFVVDFSGIDFTNNPPIFIFFMRYLILNDPLGWEGKLFYACWNMLSTFKLIMLIFEYWNMLIQEVRRKYYSSGRVLTNVDLDGDDGENTD